MEQINLDSVSLRILDALQHNGQLTTQQLADQVGLSSTPCWRRVKELEATGVIRHYAALVDRHKVGLRIAMLADVNLARHSEADVRKFQHAVLDCPQIVECYATTGEADYVIKVLTTDIDAYHRFLHDVAFKLPGVAHVRSRIVLQEVKRSSVLPLGA